MSNEQVLIDTEYITLGQLLKLIGAIDTGGQVKYFLMENDVLVNDVPENRRGKKLYPGDRVSVEQLGQFHIVNAQ